MEKEKKIEKLKFIVGRYDHYYDSVNNKGNVYLTLNTFLLGGAVTGFYSYLNSNTVSCSLMIIMAITIILNLLSLSTALWAIKPYLNKPSDNANGSLLFFGDVAHYHYNLYQKMFEELDEEKSYNDFIKQTHLLSIGLKNKFTLMKWSTYFLAGQILLLTIIGLIILNK
ncbi:MAG: hypothetical protein IT237_08700 [Bacteroidia bacterium]|nr:hypothetical protein [Bacteroidia bacterium]